MNKNTIHMLSCARFKFSVEKAVALARSYGIESEPVLGEMSTVFMNGFIEDFTNTWTDRRDGYYFIRGECDHPEWSKMLCKSTRKNGIDSLKTEEERIRDAV